MALRSPTLVFKSSCAEQHVFEVGEGGRGEKENKNVSESNVYLWNTGHVDEHLAVSVMLRYITV
jgi:hypothetical protein